MSTRKEEELLKELESRAVKWIEETLPVRMSNIGVTEGEVRRQLETEAANWVKYNMDQWRQGKEGTPTPDYHLYEEKPGLAPTVGPTGTDRTLFDEEC